MHCGTRAARRSGTSHRRPKAQRVARATRSMQDSLRTPAGVIAGSVCVRVCVNCVHRVVSKCCGMCE